MKLRQPHNLILRRFSLPVKPILQQVDDSCGLCSLHMVLSYLGKPVPVEELGEIIPPYPDIGLYDSHVGLSAIELGFTVTIYTYNYKIFHPIWNHLSQEELIEKLAVKESSAKTPEEALAAKSYIAFLRAGGKLLFYPLSKELILAHLDKNLPLIVALDMSFLYDCITYYDEFADHRATHFVVVHGYNPEDNTFFLSDPWHDIPLPNQNGQYAIDADRVINAVFLGQERNDSAIVVIESPEGGPD